MRDNILFGKPYDARRYKAVLKACALESDLLILEGGDQTEIGEKVLQENRMWRGWEDGWGTF